METEKLLNDVIDKCLKEAIISFTNAGHSTSKLVLIKHDLLAELPKHFTLTPKEPELLPCPHCGGDAYLIQTPYAYYVTCDKCQCRTLEYASKEIPIHTWQTRTK